MCGDFANSRLLGICLWEARRNIFKAYGTCQFLSGAGELLYWLSDDRIHF